MNHTDRITEMLKRLEQSIFDVGHVKTLAAQALCAAKASTEVQPLATRLEALYRTARDRRRDAARAVERMLETGMGRESAADLYTSFETHLDGLENIKHQATEAAQCRP